MDDLQRFIEAQDPVYERVLGELRTGRKQSHWMWFIFPQLRGLGHSSMAVKYGIASLDEARAYLEHPVLGARLVECTELMLAVEGQSALDILGSPDDLKFHSCMTLFAELRPSVFLAALDKYFGGQRDSRTVELSR